MDVVVALLRIANCFDFSVCFAGTMMPAMPDDLAAFDKDSADHWVRGGKSVTAAGESQGAAHETTFVLTPQSLNRASENCFASKG